MIIRRSARGSPKERVITSAGIGDRIDRVPPLVVVTAAAIRMISRVGGALFSQHLDRLTQFVQLMILRENEQPVQRLVMINNEDIFFFVLMILFEIYIYQNLL